MNLQTELQLQRLESLKRFPETIVRTETRIAAICSRCHGEIELSNSCLRGLYVWDTTDLNSEQIRSCPHCRIPGGTRVKTPDEMLVARGRAMDAVYYGHIPHHTVKITRYITKDVWQKTGWFSRERVQQYVEEFEVVD